MVREALQTKPCRWVGVIGNVTIEEESEEVRDCFGYLYIVQKK